jgi:hypothetical protein
VVEVGAEQCAGLRQPWDVEFDHQHSARLSVVYDWQASVEAGANWESRKDCVPVTTTLKVKVFPEHVRHSAESAKFCWLIHLTCASRELLHFLQRHHVSLHFAYAIRNTLKIQPAVYSFAMMQIPCEHPQRGRFLGDCDAGQGPADTKQQAQRADAG